MLSPLSIIKNPRVMLIFGLIIIFSFVLIMPVSAELRTINPGAPVFVGESNLDITKAVQNSSRASSFATLGWWPTSAAMSSGVPPTKIVYVCPSQMSAFRITSDFVDYTGNWYLLFSPSYSCISGSNLQSNNPGPCSLNWEACGSDPSAGYRLYDSNPHVPERLAFIVTDPTLKIQIWDIDTNKDITGKSAYLKPNQISQGDRLTFKILTNQYLATNPQYRPNANPATDGYITIYVSNESGMLLALPQDTGVSNSLRSLYVDSDNWNWGGSNSANTYFSTNLINAASYRCGEYGCYYAVSAASNLNGMKDNYMCSGVSCEGKAATAGASDFYIKPKTTSTTLTTVPTTVTATITTGAITTALTQPSVQPSITSTVPTPTPQVTITATPSTQTPIITTATPHPTATVNYSATIEVLQKQVDAQNAKIEEQGSWIDQILRFLGLK